MRHLTGNLPITTILLLLFSMTAYSAPQTAAVERDVLQEMVRLDGVIEAVKQSTVSAQTSGTVMQLPYDVDDSVEAGALIVQLDDTQQQARLNQAEAGLEEARTNLEDARLRFQRIKSVYERDLVSEAEFDQARSAFNAAQARLERTQAEVAEAEEQLRHTRIAAPYAGILTERHVELGESVQPGQPLLSGLSLQQLRVVVSLPQQYAELARRERRAMIELEDGRNLPTGKMTFFPFADPQTHTFRLRMELESPDGSLFPGMLVKVNIPVEERSALWIPRSSVLQRGEMRAVYVQQEDRPARLRMVRLGVSQGDRVEVLSGLSAQEQVLTRPDQREVPGETVSPQKVEAVQ